MDMCACMGAMYGEPYCPCEMERRGLSEIMNKNPLRIEENIRFENAMNKFFKESQCSDK